MSLIENPISPQRFLLRIVLKMEDFYNHSQRLTIPNISELLWQVLSMYKNEIWGLHFLIQILNCKKLCSQVLTFYFPTILYLIIILIKMESYQNPTWQEGEHVDCLDDTKRWCNAEILKIDLNNQRLRVHYSNFTNCYDEWIALESGRI